jgi:hypothetical protein
VLCHQCDFAGCTNPHHLRLGTNRSNRSEYDLRRRNIASPLSDVRGAAGHTRAVAAAVRAGLANQETPERIDERIPRRGRRIPAHAVVTTGCSARIRIACIAQQERRT